MRYYIFEKLILKIYEISVKLNIKHVSATSRGKIDIDICHLPNEGVLPIQITRLVTEKTIPSGKVIHSK